MVAQDVHDAGERAHGDATLEASRFVNRESRDLALGDAFDREYHVGGYFGLVPIGLGRGNRNGGVGSWDLSWVGFSLGFSFRLGLRGGRFRLGRWVVIEGGFPGTEVSHKSSHVDTGVVAELPKKVGVLS